ncbi:hypothetical protein CBR_g23211 [Chara braunii]|uniref:Uncharacterized protein n=1 Tax=Chara braunii TaxID=69332 RepID=A0A388JV67_CHABU|nr:hypothetical protein CBR_g23211 [Chara braunii]|eukprot:GBG61696.1 hypothetical protein CBR_g23211 [Chara braunii]
MLGMPRHAGQNYIATVIPAPVYKQPMPCQGVAHVYTVDIIDLRTKTCMGYTHNPHNTKPANHMLARFQVGHHNVALSKFLWVPQWKSQTIIVQYSSLGVVHVRVPSLAQAAVSVPHLTRMERVRLQVQLEDAQSCIWDTNTEDVAGDGIGDRSGSSSAYSPGQPGNTDDTWHVADMVAGKEANVHSYSSMDAKATATYRAKDKGVEENECKATGHRFNAEASSDQPFAVFTAEIMLCTLHMLTGLCHYGNTRAWCSDHPLEGVRSLLTIGGSNRLICTGKRCNAAR